MDYEINRFVIDVPNDKERSSADQLDMDFFIQPERRKVILGTVRLPDGTPAPCSVVKFFKIKNSASDLKTTPELEPIGHAITDDCGQFILGPVNPGERIVLKIYYQDFPIVQSTESPACGTRQP